jgi:redox-sensitive bicupin YhaK (pirin superfamily)
MKSWDLRTVEAQPHEPQILCSDSDARVIVLNLPAGEELQEHEVHERARLIVIDGAVEITLPDGGSESGTGTHMFEFAPGERRRVVASEDARLLLILTPWPGDGHPGTLSLEEKAEVRERAAEHAT